MKLLLIISIFAIHGLLYAKEKADEKGPKDEVIAVYNKKAKYTNKIYEEIEKQKAEYKKKIDLGELVGLGLGVRFHSKNLSKKTIYHDIDKLFYSHQKNGDIDTQWTSTLLGATVELPIGISVPNVFGPLGFKVSTGVGVERNYQYTVMTNVPFLEKDAKFFSKIKNKIVTVGKALGKFRVYLKPEKISQKYYPGVELVNESERSFLIGFGVNIGVMIASAEFNLYGLVTGSFKTTLKYLHSDVKPGKLFKLNVSTGKKKGSSTSSNAGIGLTLFETKHIDGYLGIKFVSTKTSRVKSSNTYYEFIYDISYPQAKRALREAMRGNLVPTQRLLFSRYKPKKYKGVIPVTSQTSKFLERLIKTTYGFALNDTSLRSMLTVSADTHLAGFFHNSVGTQRRSGEEQSVNFYEETGTIFPQSFHHTKKRKWLFGLLADKEYNVKFNAPVIKTQVVAEGEGIKEFLMNKITFSWELKENRYEKRIAKSFMERASKVLGANNHLVGENIKEFSKKIGLRLDKKSVPFCAKDITVSVKGTFYQRAIDNILESYNEREYWTMLGRFLDIKVPAKLRYEKTRKKLIKTLRYLKNPLSKLGRKSKYQKAMMTFKSKKSRKHVKKTLKWIKEFPKLLSTLSKARELNVESRILEIKEDIDGSIQERKKLSVILRKLFEKSKRDLDLFEFFTLLAGKDYKSYEDRGNFSEGMAFKYAIKGEKCDMAWTQKGDVQFKYGDLTRDW
jgi:hypothetical protein